MSHTFFRLQTVAKLKGTDSTVINFQTTEDYGKAFDESSFHECEKIIKKKTLVNSCSSINPENRDIAKHAKFLHANRCLTL